MRKSSNLIESNFRKVESLDKTNEIMNSYLLLYSVIGVVLGLLFIIKAIRNAEDDPETFDRFKNEGRFHKPANWKVGRMPDNQTNKNTLHFESIPVESEYHQMYLN